MIEKITGYYSEVVPLICRTTKMASKLEDKNKAWKRKGRRAEKDESKNKYYIKPSLLEVIQEKRTWEQDHRLTQEKDKSPPFSHQETRGPRFKDGIINYLRNPRSACGNGLYCRNSRNSFESIVDSLTNNRLLENRNVTQPSRHPKMMIVRGHRSVWASEHQHARASSRLTKKDTSNNNNSKLLTTNHYHSKMTQTESHPSD